MSDSRIRRSFLNMNKYQKSIIPLAVGPLAGLCFVITVYTLYFQHELINLILYASKPVSVQMIKQGSAVIIGVLWLLFVFMAMWIYNISLNLLGPFERVIREIDRIIGSGGKRAIHARNADDLANELLKRINILIDLMPEGKGEGDVKKTLGRF